MSCGDCRRRCDAFIWKRLVPGSLSGVFLFTIHCHGVPVMSNISLGLPAEAADSWKRREFLQATALIGVAAAASARSGCRRHARGRPAQPETLVGQLYRSFDVEQRKRCAFPFDHALRSKVDANWQITEVRIGSTSAPDPASADPRHFHGACTVLNTPSGDEPGGARRRFRPLRIALFASRGGQIRVCNSPAACDPRCDGNSWTARPSAVRSSTSRGGQFHEPGDHPAMRTGIRQRAKRAVQALDGKQRAVALLGDPARKREPTRSLCRCLGRREGLQVADMSGPIRRNWPDRSSRLLALFAKSIAREALSTSNRTMSTSSISPTSKPGYRQ